MPALATVRTRPARNPSVVPFTPRGLPSEALIDAVLKLADRRDPVGGCRVRLSVSDLDKVDAYTRALLGQTIVRLTALSIIWDEREAQIVRVQEAPPPRSWLEDEEDLMWRERPSMRLAG